MHAFQFFVLDGQIFCIFYSPNRIRTSTWRELKNKRTHACKRFDFFLSFSFQFLPFDNWFRFARLRSICFFNNESLRILWTVIVSTFFTMTWCFFFLVQISELVLFWEFFISFVLNACRDCTVRCTSVKIVSDLLFFFLNLFIFSCHVWISHYWW